MSTVAWAQLAAFLLVLLLLAWPLARVMHAVLDGRFTLGRCIEAPLYRAAGVHDDTEHDWLRYALGLLLFNGMFELLKICLRFVKVGLHLRAAGAKKLTIETGAQGGMRGLRRDTRLQTGKLLF